MAIDSMWERFGHVPEATLSRSAVGALGAAAVRTSSAGGPFAVAAGAAWPDALPAAEGASVVRRPPAGRDDAWLLVLGPAGAAAILVEPGPSAGPDAAPGRPVRVRVSGEARVVADVLSEVIDAAAPHDPGTAEAARSVVAAHAAGAGRPERAVLAAVETLDRSGAGDRAAGRQLLAEVERARGLLATRLHDGPVQDLTAALLLADAAVSADPGGAGSELAPAVEALRNAITSVRRLLTELSHDVRSVEGLRHALDATVETAGSRPARGVVDVADDLERAEAGMLAAAHAVVTSAVAACATARTPGVAEPVHRVSIRIIDSELVVDVGADGLDGARLATPRAVARVWAGRLERSPGGVRVALPLAGGDPGVEGA